MLQCLCVFSGGLANISLAGKGGHFALKQLLSDRLCRLLLILKPLAYSILGVVVVKMQLNCH